MIYFWSAPNLPSPIPAQFPPILTPKPNIPPPLLYLYLILKNQPQEKDAQNLMDENKKEMYDKDLSHQH